MDILAEPNRSEQAMRAVSPTVYAAYHGLVEVAGYRNDMLPRTDYIVGANGATTIEHQIPKKGYLEMGRLGLLG